MSHRQPDPSRVSQFRRRWSPWSRAIKFVGELTAEELDPLAVDRGEAIVKTLPAAMTWALTASERRDLARAFGRPAIRRLRERAEAALFDASRRSP